MNGAGRWQCTVALHMIYPSLKPNEVVWKCASTKYGVSSGSALFNQFWATPSSQPCVRQWFHKNVTTSSPWTQENDVRTSTTTVHCQVVLTIYRYHKASQLLQQHSRYAITHFFSDKQKRKFLGSKQSEQCTSPPNLVPIRIHPKTAMAGIFHILINAVDVDYAGEHCGKIQMSEGSYW